MEEALQIRVHPVAGAPALVYLPGLHGDWTLVADFREAVAGRVTFVEFTYPRTMTWTLTDYARAVTAALAGHGIGRGWLLAESFGSQVAWAMVAEGGAGWSIDGLILAGGFVRYRQPWLARWGARVFRRLRAERLQRPLRVYAWVVRWWRRCGDTARADLDEFVARRTEADKLAAAHRLDLIAVADWRPVAERTTLPVYHLTGGLDPVVPWRPQQRWLARHCPGHRGARVILAADHNVLGSAPRAAAEQVLRWMGLARGA